ncbi:MAG: 5-deoxy-glucuronate isomerase [Chloroflexota bacterium]
MTEAATTPTAGGLLRHPTPVGPAGRLVGVSRAEAGWRYVGYSVHRVASGEVLQRTGDADEVAVIVLEGTADVIVAGERWTALGSRRSVFDGPPPPVVLAEPGRDVAVKALGEATIAIASAPGGDVRSTRAFDPGRMTVEERGTGNTTRRVHHLLPPSVAAGRLILVEVYTPGGNWSSYPPHKHDTEDPPREAYLEEIYHYRFARPEGFALQRIYTADRSVDVSLAPGHDDLVLVPSGYHPVGMPAGYDGWYLNVMAGPTRAWNFTIDPDHAWLMDWDPATLRG